MPARHVFSALVMLALLTQLSPLRPRRLAAALSAALAALVLAGYGARAHAGGAAADEARHFPAAAVQAAFERGAPILETAGYKVHASRRDRPGLAEVHLHETDVIHVLQGEADFVTGGRLRDAATTAPGELRGPAIEGGRALRLRPGDVVVVPPGTPHWFRGVSPPFLYFVVKPISP